MKKVGKYFIVVILCLVLVTGFVLYSPRFLLYSSEYRKANAVILILGPDFKARQKEAYELIDEGMADYLIIPAYHKVYRVYEKEMKKYLSPNLNFLKSGQNNVNANKKFYEDTHLEIIEAKEIMSDLRLKSAIFVSSPYHMRRIKLIAGNVFDSNKNIFYFVPTHYEKAPADFRELSSADWKKVRREYSKILWFLLYSPWSK
ncbi:MAG: hypothetical protein APR62_11265 [Smithella sp. SDB]|nr:MAG: hypothetical protein APR62_11265 [Smithella sp. SDB]